MKKLLLYLFSLVPFFLNAQTSTYSISGSNLTTCASISSTGTNTPCGLNYDAGNIKFSVNPSISGTTLNTSIFKCTGSSSTGSVYLKISSSSTLGDVVCGKNLTSATNRTIGTSTSTSLSADLSSEFTTGTRYFTFVFINASNVRSYSTVFSVTATPPSCAIQTSGGNTSSLTSSGFTANWNSVSGAVGYQIERALYEDNTYSPSFRSTQTSTSKVFTGLSSNTRHRYRVRSQCSNLLHGPWVDIDTPTTLPPPPPTVSITTPTSGIWGFGETINISWITTLGGCPPYTIDVSTNGGSSWIEIGNQISQNNFNWTVGKDYLNNPIPNMINNPNLKLKVYCQSNTPVNNVSGSFSLAVPNLAVTTPSTLTTGQSYTIVWALNNAVCTQYTIELSTNGGGTPWSIIKTNHTSTSFGWTVPQDQNGTNINGAIGGISNQFKVYCSGYSTINGTSSNFSINSPSCNLTLPASNSGSGTNQTSTSFTANWPAVSGATEYQINVATFPNTTYSPLAFTGTTTTNSINVTGLSPATQYRFQIKAKCANGLWTDFSPTLATPTTKPPVILNNVTAPTTWHCNKNITWSSVAGIGNVTIELGNTNTGIMGVIASNVANTGTYTWVVGKQINASGFVVDFENFDFNQTYYLKIYPHNTQGQGDTGNGFTIPQPTMLVTSPAANSNYTIGQSITMDWGTDNLCGPMMVELTNTAGTTLQVMPNGTNIPNSSPYTYTVTNTFSPGSYRLKIYPSVSGGAAPVFKLTEIFNIVGQSVTVSSPAANSTYQAGTNLPINYAFSGYTGNVSIEITAGTNGTTPILPVIADGEPNTGSKSWAIPANFAPGQYRIKVYNTGPGTIVNYSGVFNIGANPNCPNCLQNLTVANFTLTGQEGFCAAQYLCSLNILDPTNSTPPTNTILREDVSKISFLSALQNGDILTVKNGGLTFPADFFPTTFIDLFQGTTGSYHRYAKILSYFQGSDQTTPFNRYTPNGDSLRLFFNPANPISRIDLIKEYLETWNIDEISNGNPTLYFTGIAGLTTEQLNYLKKAVQLGIVVNGTSSNSIDFRPNDNATREEAFLILYRLRALANPTKPDFTLNSNYYQPANQSIGNMSIMKGLEQGNFSHYQSTDFGINDIGFSLNFAHSYQSFITMLPDEWKVVQPMGYGWTHPYNAYMFTTVQINDAAGGVAGKPLLVMAWGDGTFETYDNTNANSPVPMSVGTNYNALTRVNTTTYTIKTKSQHIYTFSQQGTEAGLYRLTSIKDRYNNTLSVVYKAGTVVAFSPVKQVIDYVQAPSGRKINFTYDTQNRVTNVNFPGSSSNTRNLTFAYTGKNLTSFKDAKGQATTKTTSYSYGTGIEMYLLKQITFPKGNKIENVFDPNGRLSWTQARDANNNVTAKTEVTHGAFNATGGFKNNVSQNCSCPNASRTVDFDKNGIQTEMVNQVVTIRSPVSANHPTLPQNIQYIGGALPAQTYTPNYDALGNVLSISRPDGKTESSTYDTYNNRLTQTDAKGITTTFNWSGDGKFLNSITRPIGNGSNLTQSFGYNANGLPSSATNNEGIVTNFGYDSYGNQNLIQIPVLSISSSAVYDYASRMTSSTNARNKTTSYLYDANDNLQRETDPLNRQTNYGYDDNDNLLTITNAKNQVTTLAYDGFDRLISEEFGGKTKTYLYDNSQNRLAEFRKAGYAADNTKRFSYVYDTQNRLKGNGYITDILYDDLNRMSSIKGGTVATNQLSGFSYDALNRLTSYTDQWNNTVGYGYDDNGNETRIDYPNNNKLYKTYDNLNRLKTLTWNSTLVVTYNYVGSRLDNVVYGNGVKNQMSYDNASRPNGMSTKTNNGNGSTIYAASFVMDNLGNHTEENETHPFATIPTPTAGSTTYNYTNNRLDSESTTNGTTTTGKTYTHDNDGNITNKGFGNNMNYDLEDNLTNYTNGSTNHSYEYDAFGNRRKAIRNGTETRYIKDINGLATDIAETNSSNAVQHYYLHGLGLVARVKPDGTTIQYYHADFRGSTIAMTNASQAITHKYQYDEFGNETNKQEADPNPYRYVGAYGIMYEAPDLTYMRARYYDPTTGRFNSEDPIWSTNLYPYAGNNSVMKIDVNGRESIDPLLQAFIEYEVEGAIQSGKEMSCNSYSSMINVAFTGKPISEGMFNHFMAGNGTTKILKETTFNKVKNYFSKRKSKKWLEGNNPAFTTVDGTEIYSRRVHALMDFDLVLALGGFNIFYDKNLNIVGMSDNYNFDNETSWIPPLWMMNQIGKLGYPCGGVDFSYYYGIVK